MRLDLGPVTLDTDRHQVFRGAEPRAPFDQGLSTARAAGGKPAAGAFEGRAAARALAGHVRVRHEPDDARQRDPHAARRNRPRAKLDSHRARLRLRLRGRRHARRRPPGCRLVWGEHDILLEEGENVLGRDPGTRGLHSGRVDVPPPCADHDPRRRRDPRGPRQQERNLGRRGIESRRRRFSPTATRFGWAS